MTDCNDCGACCDPFVMVFSPLDIEMAALHLAPDELAFYRQHLTPIRRRDGRRMVKFWSTGYSEVFIPGEGWQMIPAHYYRCDRYDPVAKRCTDYEHRPDVCRGYPWYGEPPDENKSLPPTCAFNADVDRPVMPVEVAVELRDSGASMVTPTTTLVRRDVVGVVRDRATKGGEKNPGFS